MTFKEWIAQLGPADFRLDKLAFAELAYNAGQQHLREQAESLQERKKSE